MTTVAWGAWSQPPTSLIKVRGPSYLTPDNTKTYRAEKVSPGVPLFDLLEVDVTQHPSAGNTLHHLADDPRTFLPKYLAAHPELKNRPDEKDPYTKFIVVNLMTENPNLTISCVMQRNLDRKHAVFDTMWRNFCSGTQEYRDSKLKFIPNIHEGNFIVKRACGQTPALLGRKLTCTYYQDADKNYLEIDIDVASSTVGRSLFSLCFGYAASIVLDFFFLIEAQDFEELPEVLIGAMRAYRIRGPDIPLRPLRADTESSV